jgi:Kef-type K+ transport system membrane component KefB
MHSDSISHYKDALIVLGVAGLIVPLLRRLGVNTILGFLIVGFLLSPGILGQISQHVAFLNFLKLSNPNDLAAWADFGVVFLMFLIGLELSLQRLLTMKRLVFGFGGVQVFITTCALTVVMRWLGFPNGEALILAMALSLSSTAIVIQFFADEKRLSSQSGRLSFAVLLMQDLAVIPIMLLVKSTSGVSSNFPIADVFIALGQAALAGIFIVAFARFALGPFMRLVASTRSSDLFMAAVLLIVVGCGALATWAGLSMSLGAFVGGLMLAETEYRRAVEATIEPFKGLLLGAFFLLIGLGMNAESLVLQPFYILGLALLLIALKATIIFAVAVLFKISKPAAFETAMLLGPCGEFAFVVIAAAKTFGLFAHNSAADILLVVTLTMMAIPVLAKVVQAQLKHNPHSEGESQVPTELSQHVIIAGYGRVGTMIGKMLSEHNIPFIAVDGEISIVNKAHNEGAPAYYGDASNPEFLRKCGIATARALAITMDNPSRTEEIVHMARAERADLKIIVRAKDERHAMKLYAAGATEAVPETIEASLQLGEALLVESGVPMGLAIASVHERRDGFRKLLGHTNRRELVAKAQKTLRSRLE